MFFDYIDVKDFAEIVETFIKRDIKDRTYNICRGENIDLLSLANIIRDVDGRELSVNVVQDGYKPEYTGSNTRFLQEFGDFEFASFEDSITELYRWYQYESNIDFDALAFA